MDFNIPLFVKNEQLGDIQIPCNTGTFSKKLYTQACQKPFMFRSPKLRFSTAEISIELQSNYRRGRLGSRLPSPPGRHSPASSLYICITIVSPNIPLHSDNEELVDKAQT